jgi:hypothetical protein
MTQFKNIEMMNDLLAKSNEIRENQEKETQLTKKELLAQAQKKIEDYFNSVLETLEIDYVNVKINEKMDILLRIKDNNLPKGTEDLRNVLLSGYHFSSDYHALTGKHINKKWGSSYISKLSEPQILFLSRNFNEIKKKVEKGIADCIHKQIEENASKVKNEYNKLDTLKEFLSV